MTANFELWQLFAAGVSYLALLFGIAYAADQGWLPARIARHPLTYTLSLGVFGTSWTFYGSVGFAQQEGYNFLTIYLGVTLAFLLTPVLLRPILRVTREHQLASLADLFAFRYRSQVAGVLVTLFMLAGSLPYIALQIRAVTESLQVLTQEATPNALALGFCVTLTLFAVLFGARHSSAREKHEGLVVAIAFESLVKLAALLAAGLFALFGVFGGFGALGEWLAAHPEATRALYEPVREGPWATLLMLSFAAAFLLPRQFHMAFTENLEGRSLATASWGFPLYLFLLNLSIPLILWAGTASGMNVDADYYVLGITLQGESTLLPTLIYLGGISAASAMMIVTTLALSAMCLNHLLLPASYPDPEVDVYRWVVWGRRLIIGIIIMAGYGFFQLLERNQGLVQLGLISFVAVAQFLPGVVGLLYWRRATRHGFIAGLVGGAAVWVVTLLVPLLDQSGLTHTGIDLQPWMDALGQDKWEFATVWTLATNGILFVAVSLLTRPSPAEVEAAHACCHDHLLPPRGVVASRSPAQFQEQLARIIGNEAAEREVRQSLRDLQMSPHEERPAELRRLREGIERNLSGLLGPSLARVIVDKRLRMDTEPDTALADRVHYAEERLEESRNRLRGLAAELDKLRRYHRQVLQDLPLGVCAVGPDRKVASWNHAMGELSAVPAEQAMGTALEDLPSPWAPLLAEFAGGDERHLRNVRVEVADHPRVLNLHKAAIESSAWESDATGGGTVILAEDLTERHNLETELAHSERLASIGRLAAGIAHEVGNPVTGVACLAQNLLHESDDAAVEESVRQILEQTRRVSEIIQSLVGYSHSGETTGPVAIRDCVEEAIRLVRLSHAGKQIEFDNGCDPGHVARGDRQRLLQVFVNLLSNACDASNPDSRIELSSRVSEDQLVVEVVDQGAGIAENHLDRLFEPFFTTKQPGEGTGLGLPMVYKIIEAHGGSIAVDSRSGEGTRVTLRLPVAAETAA